MANERQFFRNINPGDVSIEGRKSNGITAGADGSVFLYSGVKKDELDALNEQDYNGTISIDGYKGNIIAILNGNQTVPFPEGNNNNETYFDDPQIDPNKIVISSTITPTPTPTPNPSQTTTPTPTPTPTPNLSKENKPPDPAPELEFIPEDDLLAQASAQLYDDIDFYTQVEMIDGKLFIATSGYSAKVQALYNAEKNGVNSGSKTGKEILAAAKNMVDKAIAKYPMIADKTKYPDALNRLLAMCLVAYNECRFSPINEDPNHTYNTAKKASLRKVASNLTLEQFYSKFGIKPGEESKKASGNAHTANPEAIFNYAYSKPPDAYGNGDEASGDGYKYRGRGYYGITFKDGYKAIGKAMYGDENKFVLDPDLINTEPIATDAFLTSMFEGGLCALGIGLLAYTTTPGKVGKYSVGSEVEVTLPNGTKKKIRGDRPENYTTGKGANNLVNGNDAQGYKDNFSNIYSSPELRDYINSKLK